MSQSYRKKVVDFIGKHGPVILLALLLAAVVLLGRGVYHLWAKPVRHRDSWNVPEPQLIPIEMVEARRCAAAIEKEEANWAGEMATLSMLIETERPDEFNLAKESVTNAALKDYVEKLLALGEKAVACYGRMTIAARNIEGLLVQAPQKYMANVALYRRYAEQEAYEDLKHQYLVVADIWEAKALAAEKHRGDIRQHLNTELLGYLRARNLFLERLLTTLNNGLAANDLREAAEFRGRLQELVVKHEFLRKKLDEWRARLRGDGGSPAPQPEPQKSDAASNSKNVACAAKSDRETGPEPAAPLPRVTRAVMSRPVPAAPAPVPATQVTVGERIPITRAESVAQPPRPKPGRPAAPEPVVPEPPKPALVRLQPAARQAPAAPRPEPPRTGRYAEAWGDYSAEAEAAREDYEYYRKYGCYPPVTSAVPQTLAPTGGTSVGGLYPARWTPAAEAERDAVLAQRGDAAAISRNLSRRRRGY